MKLFSLKKWLNKRNGWIDVRDTLPKEGEHVLTYRDTWDSFKVDYLSNCGGVSMWMRTDAEFQKKIHYWKYIKGPY